MHSQHFHHRSETFPSTDRFRHIHSVTLADTGTKEIYIPRGIGRSFSLLAFRPRRGIKAIFSRNGLALSWFSPEQPVDGFGSNPLRASAQQIGSIPFLFHSGHALPEEIGDRFGSVPLLMKPASAEELVEKVSDLLAD